MIFGCPREGFSEYELDELKTWLNSGGRALILTAETDKQEVLGNMNTFLDGFGVTINNDSVMRSVFYKYHHPKEDFIAEGVLVPDFIRQKNVISLGSNKSKNTPPPAKSKGAVAPVTDKLSFVYPYGVTMNVTKPARALLSSGPVSYPMNRTIASYWEADTVAEVGGKRGRFITIGSVELFSDDWYDKEENMKLGDLILSWLLGEYEFDMTSNKEQSELILDSDVVVNPIPNIE